MKVLVLIALIGKFEIRCSCHPLINFFTSLNLYINKREKNGTYFLSKPCLLSMKICQESHLIILILF